jgi:predicted CXXCH cytochrome family protein
MNGRRSSTRRSGRCVRTHAATLAPAMRPNRTRGRNRTSRWSFRGALLGVAVACTLGCSEQPSPPAAPSASASAPDAAQPPGPAEADLTLVGSDTCRSCHAEVAARWRGSHHDRALEQPSEATVLGDFSGAEYVHAGETSTFVRTEAGGYAMRDGDGALHEVVATFGIDPIQQYLVRANAGRWQALGVAWDSRPADAGGQRWFHLYPDEPPKPGSPLHWTGIDQTWNHQCAHCHSTDLRKGYDPKTARYETTWAEEDVGCEACHGPGSAHAEWAAAGARGEAVGLVVPLPSPTSWALGAGERIAAPAHLAPNAEVETCGRCHSRRALLQEGTPTGGPLLDTHRPSLLLDGLYHADGQIDDEVYVYGSFLQSRMYARGVRCSDCHEPHSLKLRADGNALCSGCHAPAAYDTPEHHHHPAESPGAECVACHMPERTYMVIDGRRDHSLRVPRPDLAAELGTPEPCTGCHPGHDASWAAAAVREWRGNRPLERHFAPVLAAGRRGEPGASAALAALAADGEAAGIVRATALHLLARQPDPAALPAIREGLADPDPLVRLGAVEAVEPVPPGLRLALAERMLRDPVRGVRIEAGRILADVPPDLWGAGSRTALADALAEHDAAQEIHLDRPESWLNLGLVHLRLGEVDRAREAYEAALALDPTFHPAAVNLADLHRSAGRDDIGEQVLRDALEITPGNAELHHALGLLLIRTDRPEAALEELAIASRLASEHARYAYVYAIALQSRGQTDAARAAVQPFRGRPEIDGFLAELDRPAD